MGKSSEILFPVMIPIVFLAFIFQSGRTLIHLLVGKQLMWHWKRGCNSGDRHTFHVIDNRINVGGGTLDGGWGTLDGPFLASLGAIRQRQYNSGNVCIQPLEGTAREGALKEAAKDFILNLLFGVFCQNHGILELYLRCLKEDVN
jgi:hypothetical protein